ncbi:hypothetical protein GN244_ATG17353 [Phytophthora infestans]|uniref:Uncharacterized protein n=1 Tax=Phytophthora infestans TaxID=4787 RepID=A0A833SAD8_PHYIN|nr:hypothetical protein GN244_ATG17353 [Phytophthora infestans]KAF4135700.1 hypothetical protein GN958_ATG15113 [Phytophthora infestans]KAF4135701.1 hypothetical protein GN958_ATG15114 [Phytophthora infestans]
MDVCLRIDGENGRHFRASPMRQSVWSGDERGWITKTMETARLINGLLVLTKERGLLGRGGGVLTGTSDNTARHWQKKDV